MFKISIYKKTNLFLKSFFQLLQTILITGYDGFIGSNLTTFLKSKGYNVIGITNNSGNSPIKKIRKDITKIISKEIKEKIHYVIHLAAITDVDYCQKNPQKCFEVNVMGTQRILEIAHKKNAKFIFLSSSHVFGKPLRIPIKEDDPKKPISIYGGSKLSGEILCDLYSKNYRMDISIVRLFSVYGKKINGNDVVSKIVNQLSNKNIIKIGNTFPKRDFIYVDDVIHALYLILKKTKGLNSYNIGTGESYSISQICNMLSKILDKKITIKSLKNITRKNDIKNIVADSSKIRKLGWRPKISLNNGLTILSQEIDDLV